MAAPTVPIVAVATASGRGAIGVVRVSGPGLASLASALCGRALEPRRAELVAFLDAAGEPIDRGLAIFFPGPHSFTGEDVLELQAHGGPVVLQLLVERVLEAGAEVDPATETVRSPGVRIARPGEFSERAFLNDKIDLAQAEAIADLIDAGTAAAARSATRSLEGAFSREIGVLAEQLIELRALVEATLDFPDEEIDFLHAARALERLEAAASTLDSVLARARQGALLREGLHVVIAGQPNVGKSSLLNALAGAELAIVTAIPGTTRDKIAASVQIDGVPVQLLDTAGLRDASDEVERIGVERSWAEVERADALVVLHDASRIGDADYDARQAEIERRIEATVAAPERIVHVFNKIDLASTHAEGARSGANAATFAEALRISARTGEGLEPLRRRLLELAGWRGSGEDLFMARARHVDALRRARSHLDRARAHADRGDAALELFAEELREAHDALGEITGAYTSDELLGEIFGRFCIGK